MKTRKTRQAATAGLQGRANAQAPLATVAALDAATFSALHPGETVPTTWEDRLGFRAVPTPGRDSPIISPTVSRGPNPP